MTDKYLHKKYMKPTMRTMQLTSSQLLAESDKELPFNPGDGTGEALAPEYNNGLNEENDFGKGTNVWDEEEHEE